MLKYFWWHLQVYPFFCVKHFSSDEIFGCVCGFIRLKSLMKWIFLFSSLCFYVLLFMNSWPFINYVVSKSAMFPQKLFPLNMVRSNWMEMIFEAWNAIDFTPNGMSNEHWSKGKWFYHLHFFKYSRPIFSSS